MKYKYNFRLKLWSFGVYSVELYSVEPPDPECDVMNLTVYIKPYEGMNQKDWPDGFWISPTQDRYNKVHRPQIIEQVKNFLVKEML